LIRTRGGRLPPRRSGSGYDPVAVYETAGHRAPRSVSAACHSSAEARRPASACVVLLERRDHLEHEQDIFRAGLGQRVQHAARIDQAGLVPLGRERPVVVGEAVGLLQLDLGEPPPKCASHA
jgi:hypothetical protein